MGKGFCYPMRLWHCKPQIDPWGSKRLLGHCVLYKFKENEYVLLHFLFLSPCIPYMTEVSLDRVLLPHTIHLVIVLPYLISLVFVHVHSCPPFCNSSSPCSPTILVHHLPFVSVHVYGLLWMYILHCLFHLCNTLILQEIVSLAYFYVHLCMSFLSRILLQHTPSWSSISLPLSSVHVHGLLWSCLFSQFF